MSSGDATDCGRAQWIPSDGFRASSYSFSAPWYVESGNYFSSLPNFSSGFTLPDIIYDCEWAIITSPSRMLLYSAMLFILFSVVSCSVCPIRFCLPFQSKGLCLECQPLSVLGYRRFFDNFIWMICK